MFRRQRIFALLVGCALALAACASQSGVPVTGETPDLPAKAVLDAQQWLAAQLSVAADQVQIVEAEQAQWSDSCLGLGRPDESCLQAVTPGWRVVLEVNGQRYEVRTDETAATIRVASPEALPGTETGLENTHWSLVSFGPAGAEQPIVEGSSITLMLAGGQAAGSGGCNSYSGSYRVDGSAIAFSEITHTEKACLEQGVTEQEQRYFEALQSAGEFTIDGDRLTITYEDNGALTFESARPDGPTAPAATPGG